jgi:hypothetical protein
MFRYFLPFVLLQPLLFSCGNSIKVDTCVAISSSDCAPKNNSNPSNTPVPQPTYSPDPQSTPVKPEPSEKERKKEEVINNLTQNSYKIGRNIIKFINTSEGLKYQRIHAKSGTITTDVCSIDDYGEVKIKISCAEKNNIREIIVYLNGKLDLLTVNLYNSRNPHITYKSVICKIKENSMSEKNTPTFSSGKDEPL